MDKEETCVCCEEKLKNTKRTEKQISVLKNRLNRIVGQIQGISKMIEGQRYCGDVLIQISAAKKALEAVGIEILRDHLSSCVAEKLSEGHHEIIDETIEIIKKL